MLLFKSIKQKFYLIVGLLLLLFCIEYVELAMFINKLSVNSEKGQSAVFINKEIHKLKEEFWHLRFWEKAAHTQSYFEAEQKFGLLIENINKRLKSFQPQHFTKEVSKKIVNISYLLSKYKNLFYNLRQLEIGRRLNRTQLDSNYQVLISTILMNNDTKLLKPLLNLDRFLDNYLMNHMDTEYHAFGMVFGFLKTKLLNSDMMDARVKSYVIKFENFVDYDFELEKQSRVINKKFDEISLELMNLFQDISQTIERLSNQAVLANKQLKTDRYKWFFISISFTFVFLIFIINVISRKIINPVRQMSKLVAEVKSGNEHSRFTSKSMDEIAKLGFAFNDMLDTVNRHHYKLEELVEERTVELSRINEQMRQEILQRIMAEEALRQAVERANKMALKAKIANNSKSIFLANMSHEIRTPMNAILNMTELTLNMDLNSKQKKFLNIIKTSGYTLLGIINDILDLSKIESGRLELEETEFDLMETCESIGDMFRNKALEKKIDLIFCIENNVPCSLIGDSLRLKQLFVNFTSNSIKFTKKGEIFIKVKLEKETESSAILVFSVKDTGIGISKENIEKLFVPFTQADTSTTRKYGGTGLGLAICKQLVEMMKGKIWVKSELRIGSTFYFTAQFGKQKKQKNQFILPSHLKGLRVLVVDDNETSKNVMKNMLNSFGFITESANSFKNAIQKSYIVLFQKSQFNLVIMDCDMPNISNIAKSPNFKNSHLSKIPFLMTGYSEQEKNTKHILKQGFLAKPSLQLRLFKAVMACFGEKCPGLEIKKTEAYSVDSFKNLHILLVEDNLINQKVAIEILKQVGIINLDIANNGREAFEAISKDNSYDIVFMDIQMPEMDGFQSTTLIRQHSEFDNIPIIAMTAHALKGHRERCFEAGMNDYITKPLNQKQFFSIMRKWTKVKEANLGTKIQKQATKATFEKKNNNEILGIHLNEALERVNGNLHIFKTILKLFIEQYGSTISEIKDEFKNQNIDEAAVLIHTFKGVIGNISAYNLHSAIIKLEDAVKKNQLDKIDLLLNKVEQHFNQVMESIKNFLSI
ncbi:two-component system, sensor histidine kinase and response regulator [Candidatus Magnetomoraceae bacterium gMMP-15]